MARDGFIILSFSRSWPVIGVVSTPCYTDTEAVSDSILVSQPARYRSRRSFRILPSQIQEQFSTPSQPARYRSSFRILSSQIQEQFPTPFQPDTGAVSDSILARYRSRFRLHPSQIQEQFPTASQPDTEEVSDSILRINPDQIQEQAPNSS